MTANPVPRFVYEDLEKRQAAQDREIHWLRRAIARTIRENLHLDGDDCTLIHLKKALARKR